MTYIKLFSTCSLFTAGAVDVYNCRQVQITDTNFVNNRGRAQIQDAPFRGNSGGIAIGTFGNNSNDSTTLITVRNCSFLGNRAATFGAEVISTNQLFQLQVFAGRGGGLGLFIRKDSSVHTTIEDCNFERNFATNFGGGAIFILDGEGSIHTIDIKNTQFIGNEAGEAGGGSHTTYLVTGDIIRPIIFNNCTFRNNRATDGAGAYVYPLVRTGASVTFKKCTFQQNRARMYGAAVGLATIDFFMPHSLFPPYIIEDW